MRYFVTIGDRTVEVDLTGATPVVDGTPVQAQLSHLPGTPVRSLIAGGRAHTLTAHAGEKKGRWAITLGGQ
ncbi:MAG: hypothetical protein ICV87_15335, partial [Gemmatimonadetes bacterium]|nr:hypothetical protein [Gemmatimonadota bacterium]